MAKLKVPRVNKKVTVEHVNGILAVHAISNVHFRRQVKWPKN